MGVQVGWLCGITVATDEDVVRFDPSSREERVGRSFISHAHGDHTAGFSSKGIKYSTAETRDILTIGRAKKIEDHHPVKYGEEVQLGDITVVAHDAGHMLGSAQFEVRCDEATVLYTGDLNCVDTLTTKAAEAVPCDILVIESTYGHPSYSFPPREETYTRIVKWAIERIRDGKTPALQAYAAGKAQELIRLFNAFTTIPIVAHPAVARMSDAYMKNGMQVTFTNSETEEGKELLQSRRCVHIVPSQWTPPEGDGYSRAVTTGWAVRFKPNGVNAAFPLSSHADFSQLTNYVRETGAKRVYTVCGFKDELAEWVRRRVGVWAQPIRPMRQRRMQEFF